MKTRRASERGARAPQIVLISVSTWATSNTAVTTTKTMLTPLSSADLVMNSFR